MKIEQVEQAIRRRWEELKREWDGNFNTMQFPLLGTSAIRIGMDEGQKPCILIEANRESELSDFVQISSGLYISVQKRTLSNEEKTLFVVAIDGDSELVYSSFISDYLLNLDLSNPKQSFEEVYKIWKKKWAGSRKPISPREEEGLIGELSVLLQLVAQVESAEELVNSWVGPFKSLHDFEGHSLHVEVKTTTRDPPIIRVSKLEQLAPRDSGNLDLLIVQMDVIDGAPTLPMLVNTVLTHEKFRPHLEQLLERLEKVGYTDKHHLHYTRGFRVGHYTCCPIDDKTPIMPPEILSEVPSTVSNIRYSLHVKGLRRASMTAQMWAQMAHDLSQAKDFTHHTPPSVQDNISLFAMPESLTLERKETIWFESKREEQENYVPKRPGMVTEVIRAVAAMMNTDGGTVLIGIHDLDQMTGLGRDRAMAKNYDQLELWLIRDLQEALGKVPMATLVSLQMIDMSEFGLDSREKVCRIDVMASPEPVAASMPNNKDKSRELKFFMRDGNGTQVFDLSEAMKIARRKWP
ncbi:PD-(D/E)XK motif protein [Candidatus Poseidoniaceae archaeon]|nr:PD-(D/E)XK motif protein [Candidatus Poseidoniaceae archaeon]